MQTNLISAQQCHTAEGWVPVRIFSSSSRDQYTVWCNPWRDSTEYLCECKGYRFRGQCHHQEQASERLCGWREIDHMDSRDLLHQSAEQRKNRICPGCGERTVWSLEENEPFEHNP